MSRPSAAVAIPWRASRTHKPRQLAAAVKALTAALPDAPIIEADSGHQPFNRAASRNSGVRRARHLPDGMVAGILVVCDADALVQAEPLREAVAAACDGKLHLPYTEAVLLSQDGSDAVHGGTDPAKARIWHVNPNSVGGCVVVAYETWQTVGGWDERFANWGFEDTAFWASVDTLFGTVRHDGQLFDLWHLDRRGVGSPQWHTGKALCDRYTDARGNPDAIRALIEERHAHHRG